MTYRGRINCAFVAVTILLLSTDALSAGTITVLHSFDGADGEAPTGQLIEGSDGNYYGVTVTGGDDDCGTVFRITPNGSHSVLHSFIRGLHGCEPQSGLTPGPEDEETFYGVAESGGTGNMGAAFRITPSGNFETIHHFTSAPGMPRAPYGRLLLSDDGSLFYGTSKAGGANPTHGSVFSITPAGDVETIHSFTGFAGGAFPHTGVTKGPDGNLYGTTVFGGTGGASTSNGVIYRVTPAGDFTVLHDITEGNSHPFDGPLVLGADGNLYGTTVQGGTGASGVAYRITPNGDFTLFDNLGFDGTLPVVAPSGGLVQAGDGNFYGSATSFFRMTSTGEVTRLTDGLLPGGATAGAVVQGSDGNFYGVSRGAIGLNQGTVFVVSLAGIPPTGAGGGGGGGGGGGSLDIFGLIGILLASLFMKSRIKTQIARPVAIAPRSNHSSSGRNSSGTVHDPRILSADHAGDTRFNLFRAQSFLCPEH